MTHRITVGVRDKRLGPGEHTIPLVFPGSQYQHETSPTQEDIGAAILYELRRRKKMEKEGGLSNALLGITPKSMLEP